MDTKTPILLDAQEMAASHPGSFEAPELWRLEDLKPGDFVKVCMPVKGNMWGVPTIGERFWCEVIEVKDGRIIGRVDNTLLSHALKQNDMIAFLARNVYQVMGKPNR